VSDVAEQHDSVTIIDVAYDVTLEDRLAARLKWRYLRWLAARPQPLEGCGTKQPPVAFDHVKHAEGVKCASCHHTQPDLTATSGEAATCVSCHKDPKDDALDCAEMSPKKNPYHINCMGCHKDSVAKDASLKGKAPTACKGCHVK